MEKKINGLWRNEHGDVWDHRFKLIDGFQTLYSDVRRGEFEGFTVVLHRPHSSTWIHLQDEDEAMDLIENHCENYDRFVEEDESLGNYLSSEEGKWGR